MSHVPHGKVLLIGVLSVILAVLLWHQWRGPEPLESPTGKSREARPATGNVRHPASTAEEARALPPGTVDELVALNPFGPTRDKEPSEQAQASPSATPEHPETSASPPSLPSWLNQAGSVALIRTGEETVFILNGKILRQGDMVDGLRVEQLRDGKLVLRRVNQD
jgi:hypothetical protein